MRSRVTGITSNVRGTELRSESKSSAVDENRVRMRVSSCCGMPRVFYSTLYSTLLSLLVFLVWTCVCLWLLTCVLVSTLLYPILYSTLLYFGQVCGIPLVVIVAVGIYRHSTLWRFASWVLYSFLLCGIPLVHVAFRSSLIAGLACAIIAESRLSPVAVVVRLLRHPACRLLLDLLV